MVTKTPFKVIHTSKTQFLEPNLVGFGRSIYDVGRWIKSGSKNLEKKKLEIFEVDFCNAVGTVNSSFQSLDLFNGGRGPFKNILNCRCWHIWKGGIWLKNLAVWGVLEKKSNWLGTNFIVTNRKGKDDTPLKTRSHAPLLKGGIFLASEPECTRYRWLTNYSGAQFSPPTEIGFFRKFRLRKLGYFTVFLSKRFLIF